MKPSSINLVVISAVGVTAAYAALTLPWSTLDGGGGRSTGTATGRTVLAVTGTIGQFEACAGGASGGGFSLNGGYWAEALPASTPDGPTLTLIFESSRSARIQWQSDAVGWQVQRSTDLAAWNDVGGLITVAGSLAIAPIVGVPRQFYRLRHP
ncbi:MAG: hypothetical protein NTW21_34715 [Verrucomicrobia bacterium]|nr:hypothetical protein [Verrucomicrobiota bacterium]